MGSNLSVDYLDYLEAKSIYLIREAYRKFKDDLAILVSWGKDSTTMLYLVKKAFFGEVPIKVLHIDTSYKFKEIYEFRDKLAKEWNLNLIIAKNEEALKQGMNPDKGRFKCCNALKTEALKQAIKKYNLKALLAAIRRDEHGIRAKERYVSFRDKNFYWNYKNQPPEFWDFFNIFEFKEEGEHLRIHPLLHWREIDIWEYIIDIDTENNDAINAIISVLGKMGRDPKAFYEKAWQNNTADASKALKYINALINDNDYKTAINVIRQTLQFNTQNITLIKKLAECYEYDAQPKEGLKVLENYARSNPRDINMQVDVTLKNIEFGNYEKAYNIISNAVKIAPQNKEVYFARAKVLEALAEITTLTKGKIDCNDKIVYHMAYEDYKKSKELGNFNAQFRIKYLYDNDLTIAKAKDRFLIGDANKVNANTYKPLGDSYSWITRTVSVK